MIKGRYTLYVALLKAFHLYSFTAKEAGKVQMKNLGKLAGGSYYYTNMLGELHRFIEDGRAVKISRGVYRLTPTEKDIKVCQQAVPSIPGVIHRSKFTAILVREANNPGTCYHDPAGRLRDAYKCKHKRRPIFVYWVRTSSHRWDTHPYTLRELMDYKWDELTEPQKEAIRTNKVGKYFGPLNVTVERVNVP